MHHSHQSGQSLMEVIVAATVGILVVSALTFATIFSLRNAGFAKTSAQATKLAQEGIERVRTGRDRNQAINGLSANVSYWSGDSSGEKAFWDYQINGNCGSTELEPKIYCYFNITDQGVLTSLSAGPTIPNTAESIPDSIFKRAVILSDETETYTNQKKVTVIVTWNDFSGNHESKLSTILGKNF